MGCRVTLRLLVAPKGDRTVASSRYRIYNLLPLLERRGWTVDVLTPSTTRSRRLANVVLDAKVVMRRHDALLVQRPGRRREELPLLRAAAARGAAVVVDVDDPMDQTGAAAWAVRVARAVVVGSRGLGERYYGGVPW